MSQDHRPTWFFHWTDVPVAANETSSASPSEGTLLEDAYAFVDAETGVDYLYNLGMPRDKVVTTFPPISTPIDKPSTSPAG